jgi:glycosyltransferase involved in cell wall biosynthesis
LNKFFLWLEKFIDNLGDCAITSSWENTGAIKKLRRDGQAETILDGVNLNYYQKFSSREASKKELELPLDKTILTYTGALIANKGINYLLSAIPLALAQNRQLFFILAGFPVAEAAKFVKEKRLEKNVRIISPLSYFDLPEILNASDIAIDPKDSSVNQASGKILQYMGAGLPIICFDKSNNRRYLDEGAYYVPEFSAVGLAKGIIELSGHLEKAGEMGQKNKERAKNFSWDHSAEKLDQIYKKLRRKNK